MQSMQDMNLKNEIVRRLFKSFESLGFKSIKDIAKKLGMSYYTVRSYLTGDRKISQEFFQKIANLGINVNWVLTGQGNMFIFPEVSRLTLKTPNKSKNLIKEFTINNETGIGGKEISFFIVPKVKARLSVDTDSFEVNTEIIAYYAFRKDWLLSKTTSPESIVLMEVSGDSMYPLIHHGDTVMIDQSQTEFVQGHIYAFGFGEEIVIKILDRLPDAILLKSYNSAYSDITLDINEWQNRVKIIGRMIWSCRNY